MILYKMDSVDAILFRPLGFDMEWIFHKATSVSERTALVQIGDERIILLIQLSAMTREQQPLFS